MNKKKFYLILLAAGLVALSAVAVLLLFFLPPSSAAPVPVTSQNTPAAPAAGPALMPAATEKAAIPLDSQNPTIQAFQRELLNTNMSDLARKSVEEKMEMANRMAVEQAAADSQPQTDKIAPPPSSASPSVFAIQDFEEGLFEGSEGMIRPSVANISNGWQGMRAGHLLQVFAGAPADRSDLGILYIFTENPVEMKRNLDVFTSPGQTGRLRILSVVENELELQTLNGQKIFFNLESKQFHE